MARVLVGQCALEKEEDLLAMSPRYIQISSGLGVATQTNVSSAGDFEDQEKAVS
jgi:hypothetical protein